MRPRRRSVRVMLRQEVVWELLDQLNISQNELERRCGISRGYMSQLMRGERSPSPRLRRRLMEALGVSDFDTLFAIVEEDEEGGGVMGEHTGGLMPSVQNAKRAHTCADVSSRIGCIGVSSRKPIDALGT